MIKCTVCQSQPARYIALPPGYSPHPATLLCTKCEPGFTMARSHPSQVGPLSLPDKYCALCEHKGCTHVAVYDGQTDCICSDCQRSWVLGQDQNLHTLFGVYGWIIWVDRGDLSRISRFMDWDGVIHDLQTPIPLEVSYV